VSKFYFNLAPNTLETTFENKVLENGDKFFEFRYPFMVMKPEPEALLVSIINSAISYGFTEEDQLHFVSDLQEDNVQILCELNDLLKACDAQFKYFFNGSYHLCRN